MRYKHKFKRIALESSADKLNEESEIEEWGRSFFFFCWQLMLAFFVCKGKKGILSYHVFWWEEHFFVAIVGAFKKIDFYKKWGKYFRLYNFCVKISYDISQDDDSFLQYSKNSLWQICFCFFFVRSSVFDSLLCCAVLCCVRENTKQMKKNRLRVWGWIEL